MLFCTILFHITWHFIPLVFHFTQFNPTFLQHLAIPFHGNLHHFASVSWCVVPILWLSHHFKLSPDHFTPFPACLLTVSQPPSIVFPSAKIISATSKLFQQCYSLQMFCNSQYSINTICPLELKNHVGWPLVWHAILPVWKLSLDNLLHFVFKLTIQQPRYRI